MPLCHGVELHFYWAHFYFQWTNSWRRRESHSTFNIVTNWASASQNFNSILFYHPKKPLYHYTIQFYNTSNIPNFYFTIQHIKIIFLCNKIIYPKTQIKSKTQITSTTCCHRCYHHHHEEHTQTETHGHHHHHGNPPPSSPWTHIWPIIKTPPPSTTITTTATPNSSTTMNPQKKSIPKSNQTNSKFRIQKMTKKKKSSQNLHKPSYKLILPLQTTPETHEHATANHHTTPPHTHEPIKCTKKYPEIATIPRWFDFPSLTSMPDPRPTLE